MSFLYSHGEASPGFLAQIILGLETFQHITSDDYRELLRVMLKIGHIERTANGRLLIGQSGEVLTNHYDFFTVFETPIEYSVCDKTHEIGTLNDPMPPKTTFVLAGKTWTVIELDKENKVIYVESARGKPPTAWRSPGGGFEHTKVLQKMRTIIANGDSYPYLTASAKMRLEEIRTIFQKTGVLDTDIFKIAPDTYGFFPWLGTRAQNALCFALLGKLPGCVVSTVEWPMITLKGVLGENFLQALRTIKTSLITIDNLVLPDEIPIIGKYGVYVPDSLLRKQFVDKYIDIYEMQRQLTIC
jgi:ATP-dependent Lhr-like helicase